MKKLLITSLLVVMASNAMASASYTACSFSKDFASAGTMADSCSAYIYKYGQISKGKHKRETWAKVFPHKKFAENDVKLDIYNGERSDLWIFKVKEGNSTYYKDSFKTIQYKKADLKKYLASIGKTAESIGFMDSWVQNRWEANDG